MFINPINVNNRVNSSANANTNLNFKPSFKRENYLKTFNQEFSRRLTIHDGSQVGGMFERLRDAASQIQFASVCDAFKDKVSKWGLYRSLGTFRGIWKDDDYEGLVELSESTPVALVVTDKIEPVVGIVNSGHHLDDNIISRLVRERRKHDVERRHIEFKFSGLDGSNAPKRHIIFGLDYDGDWYVARGTSEDVVENLYAYYVPDHKVKEVAVNGILQRYNRDGSKWSTNQFLAKDFETTMRNTIKYWTGWNKR